MADLNKYRKRGVRKMSSIGAEEFRQRIEKSEGKYRPAEDRDDVAGVIQAEIQPPVPHFYTRGLFFIISTISSKMRSKRFTLSLSQAALKSLSII